MSTAAKKKNQRFCNVPVWAPTTGKYNELSKPLERWLLHLIAAHQKLLDNNHDDIVNAFDNDHDMVKLCLKVDQLRALNQNLCEKKIILPTGEIRIFEIPAKLSTRMIHLRSRVDGNCFKEIAHHQKNHDKNNKIKVTIWKKDREVLKYMHLFDTLVNRLNSFHEKKTKIDFSSPALIKYNVSLSQPRISLNTVCCNFLMAYVPERTLSIKGG